MRFDLVVFDPDANGRRKDPVLVCGDWIPAACRLKPDGTGLILAAKDPDFAPVTIAFSKPVGDALRAYRSSGREILQAVSTLPEHAKTVFSVPFENGTAA